MQRTPIVAVMGIHHTPFGDISLHSGKGVVGSSVLSAARTVTGARSIGLNFSDTLKLEVSSAFGVSRDQLEKDKTWWRPMLQLWGDVRRQGFGEEYFIGQWAVMANTLAERNDDPVPSTMEPAVIVVSDVRTKAERDFLRSIGAFFFLVERFSDHFVDPDAFKEVAKHRTEAGMSDLIDTTRFDAVIQNGGTVETLETKSRLYYVEIVEPTVRGYPYSQRSVVPRDNIPDCGYYKISGKTCAAPA